ncbi:MAG: DUF2062 domain-containing protein [Verrucomicrobiota bacterium]
MIKRFLDYLRSHWHLLVQLHDTPHSIAGGVAIGVYIGFFPPLGFKVLSAILIAWVFRCSRVAAAVAVNWHDICWVLPPFFAVLLRAEYKIGYWICHSPHMWPHHIKAADLNPEHWFHLKVILPMIWPTVVGSALLAIPFAAAAFFIALRIVSRHQAKKLAAEPAAREVKSEDIG